MPPVHYQGIGPRRDPHAARCARVHGARLKRAMSWGWLRRL